MPDSEGSARVFLKVTLWCFLIRRSICMYFLFQPPPLLSLVGAVNSSSASYGGGSSSGFNRDRFGGFGRQNAGGKVGKRDDFKKGDFKVPTFPIYTLLFQVQVGHGNEVRVIDRRSALLAVFI